MSGPGLIWAQSSSGVIGRDGAIPWHLPEDLARFKQLTLGQTVVMGRLTWESLPPAVRPLPGRRNIVISRDPDYVAAGAQVFAGLGDALAATGDAGTWVIGGAQIYTQVLPHATRCEVTEVALDLPPAPGDALAPRLDDTWAVVAEEWRTSSTGLRYRFLHYRR